MACGHRITGLALAALWLTACASTPSPAPVPAVAAPPVDTPAVGDPLHRGSEHGQGQALPLPGRGVQATLPGRARAHQPRDHPQCTDPPRRRGVVLPGRHRHAGSLDGGPGPPGGPTEGRATPSATPSETTEPTGWGSSWATHRPPLRLRSALPPAFPPRRAAASTRKSWCWRARASPTSARSPASPASGRSPSRQSRRSAGKA